jgi:predicted transcriptional regulator
MPKYLVETVSMFRIRYVVECETADDAKDTVAMNEADEFGQLHIDENIIGCREVTDDEVVSAFFEDHPYLEQWGPEKAMEYVHKVDYGQ